MEPLKHSWAATELEDEMRNLFIALYEEAMGEKADEINVYGAPHIGPFSLVEREVAKDGLAVMRTTNEDAIRYLFKAWRFQNPRRGMHFLRTYLQVLFGDSFDVSQLWQLKSAPYPTYLRGDNEVLGRDIESDYFLTSRVRVDIDTEFVPQRLAKVLRTTVAARFLMDVRTAKYGESAVGVTGLGQSGSGLIAGNVIYPPQWYLNQGTEPVTDYGRISRMIADLWSYLQRATGAVATAEEMPMLITGDGLVKNNQFVGGALGGYTPDGVASSEGISLMMRGLANAYLADGDEAKLSYLKMLMDACCKYYFFDTRPTADADTPWYHTWMVNAGPAFNVRGPLAENGSLAESGYIGVKVNFVDGVGYLNPAPDLIYQVVTDGSEYVWDNVFSELVAGTGSIVSVAHYIDVNGNKIYGVQKGGSFGQPIEPDSGETPGKVVLSQNLTGTYQVSYSVTVPGVTVEYGEPYEAWPMWRKLASGERSIAADALHWFADAFRVLREAEPDNPEWGYAHDRMLDVWKECCDQESNSSNIFLSGASGPYNDFPLTYSYAYGVDNVDDSSTQWSRRPPTDYYSAVRAPDGYVTFTLPKTAAELGSGGAFRYGMAFENKPMYLSYTDTSYLYLDVKSSEQTVITFTLESDEGVAYDGSLVVDASSAPVTMAMDQFLHFQSAAGDATGDKTGDWSDTPVDPEPGWEPPVYDAVAFPGRRAALIGDSITNQNSVYVGPNSSGRYENYTTGMAGYFNWAMALGNHPLEWEPGVQENVNGNHSGYNLGISGSCVVDWWKESFAPLPDGVMQMGPMWGYKLIKDKVDTIAMMGGTNDLARNLSAAEILLNIQKAAYECAADGKWVFLMTIMPRTTDLLTGYTLSQQDMIRQRLLDVNAGLRAWISTKQPPNIFLVDTWSALVGPNGIDPHGCVSDRTNPNGTYSAGNWKPGIPQVSYFPDGLHPGIAAAQVVGQLMLDAMTAAGVPARSGNNLGPLVAGANLLANSTMAVTTTHPATGYSNTLGRSIGLGSSLTDATHPRPAGISTLNNLGLGYEHGQVPDNWFIYRSSNLDNESFSNFNEYNWSDLVGAYPSVAPYMAESTWANGALKTSIVLVGGVRALKVEFSTPATGNKNEAFVIKTNVPAHQNGPWNNYGYDTTPQTPPPTNTAYAGGDYLGAEAEVIVSNVVGLHSMRLTVQTLSLDEEAIAAGDMTTTGAVCSSVAMGQGFWPPSLVDLERFYPTESNLRMKSPIIVAPTPKPKERTYASLALEVSVDASSAAASVTVIILNPRLSIFTGAV